MLETAALSILAALAQPTRLKVVALLSRAGSQGLSSGEIADAVGVPRHLMSSHLSVLSKADAVMGRKSGRTVVYSISEHSLSKLIQYLQALTAHSSEGEATTPRD